MKRLIFLCICSLCVTGCASRTLKITRVKTPPPPAAKEELPGLPFYIKTAACRHQSVWLQPVYTLTLSTKVTAKEEAPDEDDSDDDSQSSDKKSSPPARDRSHSAESNSSAAETPKAKGTSTTCSFTKVIPLSVYNAKEQTVQKLQALLSEASATSPGDTGKIKKIFEAWNAIAPGTYDPLSANDDETIASPNVYVASNTVAPELYVDYNTTYYFNSKSPLAGSSQATAKLADDGTLTEATAQVESKTLATFLALLPVSDVLKTVATGALPAVKFAPEVLECASPTAKELTYDFDLKITTKALKRAHSAFVLAADSTLVRPPCGLPTTLVTKASYAAYNASVEEVSADGESKADSNTIKVSGTVTLPKATDKAADKPK